MTELLVITAPGHARHHIRESGYVESPRRIASLSRGIESLQNVRRLSPQHFPDKHVTAVHDPTMVNFIRAASARSIPGKNEYAYLFPTRNLDKPPRDWTLAVGYYCMDTFTPIHRDAWATARQSVDAALTGARALRQGLRYAYAMVRPPGHHAERSRFGGFCYLNASAIAAHYLSRQGTVAMLDVDYHHGNGQQDIFWQRDDVLTVSIHCHPRNAYPYYTGYADEKGEARGQGCNINFPLPAQQSGAQYRRALKKAIAAIEEYDPAYLVVPLGLDPARNDPTGSWTLDAADFFENGRMIAELDRPTLFVQEGGYRIGTLGKNVRAFFRGVLA